MNTATAPSPFIRATDAAPVPDRFLPGDGGPGPGVSLHVHVRQPEEVPLAMPNFEDTREAVRAAEERLARIRIEEEALARRRTEMLGFQKEVNEFQTGLVSTLGRLRQLEEAVAEDGNEARHCAATIHRTIHQLQIHLSKLDRVQPDEWTKTRMKAELDLALELLADVDRDTKAELSRLDRELPKRTKRLRDGWLSRALYGITSAFAFLLPLLVFVAVAVILVLTALGLV